MCWSSQAPGCSEGQILVVIERNVAGPAARLVGGQVEVARANAKLAENNLRERASSSWARVSSPRHDIDQKTATRDAALAQQRVAEAQLGQLRGFGGPPRHPRAGIGPGPHAQCRARPGRVRPAAARCSASPRMAKWNCSPSCPKMSSPLLRPGVKATVTPVGTSAKFVGTVAGFAGDRPAIAPRHRPHFARL